MIPTQTSQATQLPDAAWDGAAGCRTDGWPEVVTPVTTSGRSEQTCTQCGRSGTGMTTIALGGHRWRYCGYCSSRADKTTVVKAVTCAHPFLRTALDGVGYDCLDCFEPQPGPPLLPEELGAGHAALALVIPVMLCGGLLALAGASGKLRYLVTHLRLPEPGLNGWSVFVLAALAIGVWQHLARVRRATRGLDRLLFNEKPRPDPWFGTAVYDPDRAEVSRRRSYPDPSLEDLPPDIAELDPTLLPRHRPGWRS
jgi:hypothetical protein